MLGWATARKLSAVFIGFWQRRGLVLKVLLIGGGLFSCLGVLVSAVLLTLMSGFFFVLNAPQVEMEYVTANCDKFTAGGLALETPLSWVARDWDNCEAYGWRGRESHNGDHFAHIGSAANAEVYEAASEPEEQGYWVWGEGRPYLGLCRLA